MLKDGTVEEMKEALASLAVPLEGECYYDVDFGAIIVVRAVTDGRVYYVNRDEPLAANNVPLELWLHERERGGITYESKLW